MMTGCKHYFAGSDDAAPAGTCNTGVMYFDSVTVDQVQKGIEKAIAEKVVPEVYLGDRFLDSLFLVAAINSEGIPIRYWPYSMNYMSFFHGEYATMDQDVDRVYLAHFLWEPEFYCTVDDGNCQCVLKQEEHIANSVLHRTLNEKIDGNESVCFNLAGADESLLPKKYHSRSVPGPLLTKRRSSTHANMLATLVQDGTNSMEAPSLLHVPAGDLICSSPLDQGLLWTCSLEWPPSNWITKHLSPNHALAVQFIFQCQSPLIAITDSAKSTPELERLFGRLRIISGNTAVQYPTDLTLTSSVTDSHSGMVRYYATESIDIMLHDQTDANDISQLPYPHVHNTTVNLIFDLFAAFPNCQTHLMQAASSVVVVQEAHLPRPTARFFAPHHLAVASSSALDTQLLLPEYLLYSSLLGHDATRRKGLRTARLPLRVFALCCETNKGMQTVQRLVEQVSALANHHIAVFLVTLPQTHHMQIRASSDNDPVIQLLGEHCQQLGRCHVVSFVGANVSTAEHPPDVTMQVASQVQQLMRKFTAASFDVVYIDTILPSADENDSVYNSTVQLLRLSFRMLRSSFGMLIGSRYVIQSPAQWKAATGQLQRIRVDTGTAGTERNSVPLKALTALRNWKQSADTLALESNTQLLFTHGERQQVEYCPSVYSHDIRYGNEECSPAWYMLKT